MTAKKREQFSNPKTDSQTEEILGLISQFQHLRSDPLSIEHPLYHEFSLLCNQAEETLQKAISLNKSYISKIVYNYKLIEQLNQHILEIKTNYNKDRKKLTESLGSAYLQAEQASQNLQIDTSKMNDMLEDRVSDLIRENTELKRIARENIKESQLKTDFLNVLSHELRTPLNAIIGYSQIIKNGIYGPVNESIENDIDAINKNGKHLLTMINQMLDFAKYGSGKIELSREKVNIASLFESVIKQLNSLISSKAIQFQLVQKEGLEEAFFDKSRIFQVLCNLVDNAIKHTEQGYVKLISDYNEKTRELILSCEDSGIGVDREDIEKVFDPFQQVHRKKSSKEIGTGLGLAICKKIVELHNGHISMSPNPDKGMSVHIRLPQR